MFDTSQIVLERTMYVKAHNSLCVSVRRALEGLPKSYGTQSFVIKGFASY